MPDRSSTLVSNAADPQQVNRARRKEKDRDARLQAAVRAVLTTVEGRIVCWHVIEQSGFFESPLRHGTEWASYLGGQQDLGRSFRDELIAVDDDLYELMEREHRAAVKAEQRENAAAHTARTGVADEEEIR